MAACAVLAGTLAAACAVLGGPSSRCGVRSASHACAVARACVAMGAQVQEVTDEMTEAAVKLHEEKVKELA